MRRSSAHPSRHGRHTNDYHVGMTVPDHAPPGPGPYLQTVSGRWVNPFDPDPAQLDAGDIARALANQCRFGGHCRVFYSVAQHSVIVSRLVEERGGDVEDVFAALMHDAAEAYLGDMPHPLKHRSALGAAFKQAEEHLERAIRDRFGIRPGVAGSSRPTARCWPPSGGRSAPRRGTGPSSTASSRSTASSPRGRRSGRRRSSRGATPSWRPGASGSRVASWSRPDALGSAHRPAGPPRPGEAMSGGGPVGVGVVGAGTISEQYLANMATFPDLDVRFVADLRPEVARRQADRFGVAGSGTVAEALAHDGVELVVNLTVPAPTPRWRRPRSRRASTSGTRSRSRRTWRRARPWSPRPMPPACSSAPRPTRSSAPACRPSGG